MDKEALFKRRIAEEDVELPGVGTVRIRALSREQALQVRDKPMPVEEMERKLLAWALVDPEMSEEDVRRWQQASGAGEIERVTDAITELSGLTKSGPESGVQGVRG